MRCKDEHTIRIKPGDTNPIEITITARRYDPGSGEFIDMDDLDDLASARLVMVDSVGLVHVDAPLTVVAGLTMAFDPVGNGPLGQDAFSVGGQMYEGHVVAEWDDGTTTRHPSDGWLYVAVDQDIE